MKELYNHIIEVSINDSFFEDTSIFNHVSYMEYEKAKEYNFNNFEDFYEFVKNNDIIGIKAGKTMIFNKPAVYITRADSMDTKRITKRNFKKISIVDTYRKYYNRTTIKELAYLISAEDFVEWLKDRDINLNRYLMEGE